MRHEPALIGRIAGEAATDMVVHAAGRHGVEGFGDHRERVRIAGSMMVPQQERQAGGGRELRRATESAELRIEFVRILADGRIEFRLADRDGSRHLHGLLQLLCDVAGLATQTILVLAPELGDLGQDRGKPWPAPAIRWREIGARKDRLLLGRQENRHRPAAVMRHHLYGAHVNLVEIRSFFTVNFDVDEVLVHQLCNRLVLKRLVLHYMTPVTCRIADA